MCQDKIAYSVSVSLNISSFSLGSRRPILLVITLSTISWSARKHGWVLITDPTDLQRWEKWKAIFSEDSGYRVAGRELLVVGDDERI